MPSREEELRPSDRDRIRDVLPEAPKAEYLKAITSCLVESLKPRRVFDASCGEGLLVEAFRDWGVEAWGIDASPCAIQHVRPNMQDYCHVGSASRDIQGPYDLITCLHLLEHMHESDAQKAIQRMCEATETILFSCAAIGSNGTEPRPRLLRWVTGFQSHGFAPDPSFDATFVNSHAMLLRRSPTPWPTDALQTFIALLDARAALSLKDRLNREEVTEVTPVQKTENQHDLRIAALEAAIRDLENSIAAIPSPARVDQAADAPHILRLSLQSQLRSRDIRITALEDSVRQILESRIWRTLRAVGGILLRLVGSAPEERGTQGSFRRIDPREHSEFELHTNTRPQAAPTPTQNPGLLMNCDEPLSSVATARSGLIRVRGWALCAEGIDRIEVQLGHLPPIQAERGIARPDVKKAHAQDTTGRSGFICHVDSCGLPGGTYPLSIRAYRAQDLLGELSTSVLIDHLNGYASDYYRWIAKFEKADVGDLERRAKSIAGPVFSILMPTFNTSAADLKRAIESVGAQFYPHWELCVADDHSTRPEVRDVVMKMAAAEPRIKYVFRPVREGIAAATMSALELASGAYVALLDHDDELAPHALAAVAEALGATPDVDVLYSDEDKIDIAGFRYDPFFKPDWSPDLLLSENYVGHLMVVKRGLLEAIGGFRSAYDGSQDYDVALRAVEGGRKVVHVPKILYHWRAAQNSTALDPKLKGFASTAAQRALQDWGRRNAPGATIETGKHHGRWRVRYPISNPLVSIVIASGGKEDLLRGSLTSIASKTNYPSYEVVIIDNSKTGDAVESVAREWKAKYPATRYVDWRCKPFNYSAINNAAARQCDSPVLLFLNDDTLVIESEWLTAMVELIERSDVGAVGAKLLYPDGRIQHGGVIMGPFENCGHAFKGLDGSRQHYFDLPDVIRNVSAVTGACLMTKTRVFEEVGGFDEDKFAVAFNDIDLCLKIGAAGYKVLYTPHALLYHCEAYSKTDNDLIPHPSEVAEMQRKWSSVIARDPFYNPNLTRADEDFSLR